MTSPEPWLERTLDRLLRPLASVVVDREGGEEARQRWTPLFLSDQNRPAMPLRPGSLAILGPPGSGKSTLATQLACAYAALRRVPVDVVGIEQNGGALEGLARLFGWGVDRLKQEGHLRFLTAEATTVRARGEADDGSLTAPDPGLVVFDGICGLQMPGEEERGRWVRLLQKSADRGTFVVLVGDEPETSASFIEYLVDVVLRIGPAGPSRRLTVPKSRYVAVHPGPHTLRVHMHYEAGTSGGVEFLPAPDAVVEPATAPGQASGLNRFGVDGFEKLFGADGTSTLAPGESVLVSGSPGTAKTAIALQFLCEGIGCTWTADSTDRPPVLLVHIDHPRDAIEREWERLPGTCKALSGLFDAREGHSPRGRLGFQTRGEAPSAIVARLLRYLDADEQTPVHRVAVVGLEALLGVVDSASERRWLLTALLDAFRRRKVRSLFIHQSPGWFRSLAQMPSDQFDLFDTVLVTRLIEEMNRAVLSIQAVRSRGRAPGGPLLRLSVDARTGVRVDTTPWSKAGLVSGDPAAVEVPSVFLKLFYENPSDLFVNSVFMKRMKDRYLGNHVFTMVYRETPPPDHFSFRGYGGTGHANVKVLLLRKAVLDVIDREGRLQDMSDLIPESWKRLSESDPSVWERCAGREQRWRVLPCYVDVAALFRASNTGEAKAARMDGLTWEEFRSPTHLDRAGFQYLLALPNLAGRNRGALAALFLSLVVSKGVFLAPGKGSRRFEYADAFRRAEPGARQALELMHDLVASGAAPNPFVGCRYDQAMFSWRWISSVEPYQTDERYSNQLIAAPHYKLRDIARERGRGKHRYLSVGCQSFDGQACPQVGEIYGLSVLRGALAPETGWYLVQDLIEAPAAELRVAFRRGWPARREQYLGAYRTEESHRRDGDLYDQFVEGLASANLGGPVSNLFVSDYPFALELENAILAGLKTLYSAPMGNDSVDRALAAIRDRLAAIGENASPGM